MLECRQPTQSCFVIVYLLVPEEGGRTETAGMAEKNVGDHQKRQREKRSSKREVRTEGDNNREN